MLMYSYLNQKQKNMNNEALKLPAADTSNTYHQIDDRRSGGRWGAGRQVGIRIVESASNTATEGLVKFAPGHTESGITARVVTEEIIDLRDTDQAVSSRVS